MCDRDLHVWDVTVFKPFQSSTTKSHHFLITLTKKHEDLLSLDLILICQDGSRFTHTRGLFQKKFLSMLLMISSSSPQNKKQDTSLSNLHQLQLKGLSKLHLNESKRITKTRAQIVKTYSPAQCVMTSLVSLHITNDVIIILSQNNSCSLHTGAEENKDRAGLCRRSFKCNRWSHCCKAQYGIL